MVTEKTITVYETRCGKQFFMKSLADEHEAKEDLSALMDREGVGRGGEWNAGMLEKFILENAKDLHGILGRIISAKE